MAPITAVFNLWAGASSRRESDSAQRGMAAAAALSLACSSELQCVASPLW